ncbi:MAG: hypothetical protein KAT70_00830 [Thermoplasmata archaeon]|nr:hypothetical protein [Thermoplasmata archaeon]
MATEDWWRYKIWWMGEEWKGRQEGKGGGWEGRKRGEEGKGGKRMERGCAVVAAEKKMIAPNLLYPHVDARAVRTWS